MTYSKARAEQERIYQETGKRPVIYNWSQTEWVVVYPQTGQPHFQPLRETTTDCLQEQGTGCGYSET